jgi:hypothetical protein
MTAVRGMHAKRGMIRRAWAMAGALALAACLGGCGRDTAVAGGATDTETGGAKASGRILLADGSPAACADVEIRPVSFLKAGLESEPTPKGTRKTGADAAGRYSLDSIPAGSYRLVAHCGEDQVATSLVSIADTSDRKILTSLVLAAAGRMAGSVGFAHRTRARASLSD